MTPAADPTPATTAPRRVCLLRLSALGDVVLTLPALDRVLALPGVERVVYVTSPGLRPLFAGYQDPRLEVVGLPKPAARDLPGAWRRLKALGRFDAVLAMQASLRANLLYPALRAPLKVGFDPRRARDGQGMVVNRRIPRADEHLLDGFLAFARALGAPELPVGWRLPVTPAARDWAAGAAPAGYVLVNPAASRDERTWAPGRTAAVCAWLSRQGVPVVLCGGPSARERALARAVVEAARTDCGEGPGQGSGSGSGRGAGLVDLTGQTDLPRLLALIGGARALVSPDSGPVHLARALDVPVVGLYAVARPALTGPWRALEHTIDAYPEAARRLLGPATPAWHARVHDARAMDLIAVSAVTERLAALLGGGSTPVPT